MYLIKDVLVFTEALSKINFLKNIIKIMKIKTIFSHNKGCIIVTSVVLSLFATFLECFRLFPQFLRLKQEWKIPNDPFFLLSSLAAASHSQQTMS